MPKAGLSPQAVVAEAERLADEAGLDNLTLAALAARLGVRQPSLYKHIASLAALRQVMAVRTVTEMTDVLARAAAGRSQGDAIAAMARAYREWAKAHPGRYEAGQRAPDPDDPAHQAAGSAAIALFSDVLAGFDLRGDEAIDAIRTLRSAVHGFVSLEMAGAFAIPLDLDRSYERLISAVVASLSTGLRCQTTPEANTATAQQPGRRLGATETS
jgi:AcrR family transcriptional regulator